MYFEGNAKAGQQPGVVFFAFMQSVQKKKRWSCPCGLILPSVRGCMCPNAQARGASVTPSCVLSHGFQTLEFERHIYLPSAESQLQGWHQCSDFFVFIISISQGSNNSHHSLSVDYVPGTVLSTYSHCSLRSHNNPMKSVSSYPIFRRSVESWNI